MRTPFSSSRSARRAGKHHPDKHLSYSYSQVFQSRESPEDLRRQGGELVVAQGAVSGSSRKRSKRAKAVRLPTSHVLLPTLPSIYHGSAADHDAKMHSQHRQHQQRHGVFAAPHAHTWVRFSLKSADPLLMNSNMYTPVAYELPCYQKTGKDLMTRGTITAGIPKGRRGS